MSKAHRLVAAIVRVETCDIERYPRSGEHLVFPLLTTPRKRGNAPQVSLLKTNLLAADTLL